MAGFQVYKWYPLNTTAIASLQTLAGAGSLVINFGSATPNSTPYVNTYNIGMDRVVSLTSANNLGGVNFTITGTLDGQPVSETRVGPNNNNVETTQLFSTVDSITTNGAAAAVSAGYGTTGRTPWFIWDPYVPIANLSCAVVVTNGTGAINYSFVVTLDDVTKTTTPTLFTPVAAITAQAGTALGNLLQPVRYCAVRVNSSSGTATLTTTMVQQGLRA